MCLICISPRGTKKDSDFFIDTLKTGMRTNKDGAGFAYKREHSKAVYFNKGFWTVDSLIHAIKQQKLRDEDELIVHFRWATHGKKTARNTHPFVLTTDDDGIDDVGPSTSIFPIMFHNGVLSEYGGSYGDDHSDTYNFVREFMRFKDIYTMMRTNQIAFRDVFHNVVGGSRLAFLYPNTTSSLVTYGTFVEDNGYMFSNSGYKSSYNYDSKTSNYIENQFKGGLTNTQKVLELVHNKKTNSKVRRSLFHNDEHYNAIENKITFNPEIYDEVVYIANKDNGIQGFKAGEKFLMDEWDDSKQVHMLRSMVASHEIIWVSRKAIKEDFDLIAKSKYQPKYSDYFRLNQLVNPSKNSVKKIYRTWMNHCSGRRAKPDDTRIKIKYNNKFIDDIRVDAVKLFLKDHEHFIENSVLV